MNNKTITLTQTPLKQRKKNIRNAHTTEPLAICNIIEKIVLMPFSDFMFCHPKEYVSVNEDNEDEISLIKETYDTDGSAITKYITATVYDKTDTDYYVDTGLFEEGDYVLMKDSSKRYQISETKSLIGVYNINKGYAVFREITIIDENEEYCIVESNSSYGLAQYDHIALDASTVKEDAIVV